MNVMNHRLSRLIVVVATASILFCEVVFSQSQQNKNPIITLKQGNEIQFIDAHGDVVRTAKLPFEVLSYTISPDMKFAALIKKLKWNDQMKEDWGGHLYIIDLTTQVSKRIL